MNPPQEPSPSSPSKTEPLLALTPTASEAQQNQSQKINVSSSDDTTQTVKLDHLGPMVVNTDGTLSRIQNWEGMSEAERERTMKVLGKRNAGRLAALRREEEEGRGVGLEQEECEEGEMVEGRDGDMV